MSPLRHHLKLHRWPAAWLVAVALLARLLVPAGYMPMQGKAGVEICSGQTMVMAAPMSAMPGMSGMGGMEHDKHHLPQSWQHSCPFASIGGAADLPTLILPSAPLLVALAVLPLRSLVTRPGLGLAAPPPPKTGPPSRLR